jgi:proline dehydrogenase
MKRVQALGAHGIRSILDYSVEGLGREEDFEDSYLEMLKVTRQAAGQKHLPFTVFKPTGLGPFELLEKLSSGAALSAAEQKQNKELRRRIREICAAAATAGVRVLVDAEESWIQDGVDSIVNDMMREFNVGRPVVYNTIQLYRHDRLAYLRRCHQEMKSAGSVPGFKLVRGAYMEKERARAKELGYPSPIQPDREATDRDYNAALTYCIQNIDSLGLFAGTHNEASTRLLIDLMAKHGLQPGHERVEFSQLLGMGDNLSFNLAYAGYHVSKYVPYGPVKSVLPYLIRRAQENSSIQGQAGRELTLINTELRRRGSRKQS